METSEQWYKVICSFIDELDEQSKQTIMQNFLLGSLVHQHLSEVDTNYLSDDKQLVKKYKRITAKKISIPYRVSKIEGEQQKVTGLVQLYKVLKEKGYLTDIDSEINGIVNIKNFYELWIEQALIQLNYVTHATHVAKLTHSSSGGSSVIDGIQNNSDGYLTTSALEEIIYDGAYPDAIYSKIVKFLLLECDGVTLGDLLKSGDMTPLKRFVGEKKLKVWQAEFTKRLNPTPKADSLAKQVYFPVNGQQDNYHLLVVMQSSTLIQIIYNQYFHKDVRKANDKVYKLKEKEKYSEQLFEQIPNSIALATVMSQPQNVSVNSGSRGGNIRVFSGAPPTWKATLKPPIYNRSIFYERQLNFFSRENIKGLQKMLVQFHRGNISFKDPKRLKGVVNWVTAIVNDVFDYSQILLALPKGWTSHIDCRLPVAQQIFLDFYRDDEAFIQLKQQKDWQKQLTNDFVAWLNRKLKDEQSNFSASEAHSRVWRDTFKDMLREHVEMLSYEVELADLDKKEGLA